MDSVLAILLPLLLFAHVLWALLRAGRRKRALLTVMPSVSFAIAMLWLASSILALWNGGLSVERAHANHTLGPVLLGVMVFTTEFPFLVNRGSLWWQARRADSKSTQSVKVGTRKKGGRGPVKG
jgi:hypothetical protein